MEIVARSSGFEIKVSNDAAGGNRGGLRLPNRVAFRMPSEREFKIVIDSTLACHLK
jgi:hypothetical protein